MRRKSTVYRARFFSKLKGTFLLQLVIKCCYCYYIFCKDFHSGHQTVDHNITRNRSLLIGFSLWALSFIGILRHDRTWSNVSISFHSNQYNRFTFPYRKLNQTIISSALWHNLRTSFAQFTETKDQAHMGTGRRDTISKNSLNGSGHYGVLTL